MILPDANVLLYAFRTDYLNHARHLEWVRQMVEGDTVYGISPQVLGSFIRISTNARIHPQPAGLDKALEFANALLSQPHCQMISPGPRHWEIFTRLCREAHVSGDLTRDAWFAALAIESGCEWITHDRDYARFPRLRWRPPF